MTLPNIDVTSSILCPFRVSGDGCPRSTRCVCVCVCVCVFIPQASPHCPVYRNNSVMLFVTEHTPNSQRQTTLSVSKPSQQLTSRKTALSTQKYWKVAFQNQERQRIWNSISPIHNLWQYHVAMMVSDDNTMVLWSMTKVLNFMYCGIYMVYSKLLKKIPWYTFKKTWQYRSTIRQS